MKRWVPIWLLVICGLAAPAATAQGSSSQVVFGSLDGHQPVSTTNVPMQTSGQLTVSFHGDPSTGCAAQGICGYRGTVVFTPGGQGDLGLLRYRIHGRDSYQVDLSLISASGGTLTGARVTRASGGECSDAEQPNAELSGSVTGGEVAIALFQPEGGLLSTRCAGPLDGDLAGAGPQIRLTVGQLLGGRRTVPLGGTWSFAAGGFAGTVESNLTVTLGRPSTQKPSKSTHFPRGIKTQRDRELTETLTLVRGTGSQSLALSGDPSTCEFLDSCGIGGTIDGTFAPTEATASVLVIGRASRPYADFLAALGLSRRGNPHGLEVLGEIGWAGGGTVASRLEQAQACTSSAPMPGGVVTFSAGGRRLIASYSPLADPRTRCPGPDFGQFPMLASGSVGPSALTHRTFTLRLIGSGPLTDDGYTITQRTSLTLRLKRGRLHAQTIVTPTG